MLCQKCGLTEATTHRRTVVFRQAVEEHLCFLCAGDLAASLQAHFAKQAAITAELPWRLAGEWVGEKREIQANSEGLPALRLLIANLIERSARQVQLSITFGPWPQFNTLSFNPSDRPGAIHWWLFNPTLELEVRNRADKFFASLSPESQIKFGSWKCDLPSDAHAITDACIRLFSEVFALPQDVILKVKLEEYVASAAEKSEGQ